MPTWWVSLALAGTLGGVLYLITSSLPFLVSSPTTDSHFGALNSCVLKNLAAPRLGYAVSWDLKNLVSYSASELVWCHANGDAQKHSLQGITRAAFDGQGTLWLATRASAEQPPQLLYWNEQAEPSLLAQFAPTTLVGVKEGVVILGVDGQVTSLRKSGQVAGSTSLKQGLTSPTGLIANDDGSLVLLVAATGVFAFQAHDATEVRRESPCPVEYAWWLPNGTTARLACAPNHSWALDVDMRSGTSEKAELQHSGPSTLLPLSGLYVESCDGLPCTAPAP
ncbi:MAG: hypothetical protein K1X64_00885 [Myxococcaceae bacterium]|nr:hypothetical protein [Myxococcaceae bacterium]